MPFFTSAANTSVDSSGADEALKAEVEELRKRVKELEHGETETVSSRGPSEDEADEVLGLRKQLAELRDEKAKMELDFLNQLTSLSGENQGELSELRNKLEETEKENAALQEKASAAEGLKNSCIQLDQQLQEFRSCHISEMKRVRQESQQPVNELRSKLSDAENEKTLLLQELSEIRIQLADEGQASSSAKSQLENLNNRNQEHIEHLKTELKSKDGEIEKMQESVGEMNDTLIEMEGQKAVLLDEIVRMQRQVERETQKNKETRAQLADMTAKLEELQGEKEEFQALEEWARSAEAKAEKLENSIAEVTDNLTTQVVDLEESLQDCTVDLARKEQEIEDTRELLDDEKRRCESISNELNKQIKEKEAELSRVRESLEDEEGKGEAIAIELRSIIAQKQEEIDSLRNRLGTEKEKTEQMEIDKKELKSKLDKEMQRVCEQEAELVNLGVQREAYEKRTTQNMMDQVSEVDSLREQNHALYDQVQNLSERLENETEAASKLMLELSDLKATQSRQAMPMSPDRRRSKGLVSPDGSPVKQLVAQYERSSPAHSTVSNGFDSDFQAQPESEKVKMLQEKLQRESETVGELRAEIASLQVSGVAGFEKRYKDDQQEIQRLKSNIEILQQELDTEVELVSQLRAEITDLKSEDLSDCSGEYDRYSSNKKHPWSSKSGKKAKIAALQESLATAQMANADMERDYMSKVKSLEECIDVMEKEMERELTAREDEIASLQKKLDWQMEEISRLEMEREQLCSNIDGISAGTQEEVEKVQREVKIKKDQNDALSKQIKEMQSQLEKEQSSRSEDVARWKKKVKDAEERERKSLQKVNDATSKQDTMSQQIQELQSQLEQEQQGSRGEEVQYWKQKVKDIEERERKSTRARMNHVRSLDEMKAENEKLRSSVQSLTKERKALQEKLKSGGSRRSGEESGHYRSSTSGARREADRRKSQKPSMKARVEI